MSSRLDRRILLDNVLMNMTIPKKIISSSFIFRPDFFICIIPFTVDLGLYSLYVFMTFRNLLYYYTYKSLVWSFALALLPGQTFLCVLVFIVQTECHTR